MASTKKRCCCTPPDPSGKWDYRVTYSLDYRYCFGICEHTGGSTENHFGVDITTPSPQPDAGSYFSMQAGVWRAKRYCADQLFNNGNGSRWAGWAQSHITVPKAIIKDPNVGITINMDISGTLDDTKYPQTCRQALNPWPPPKYSGDTYMFDYYGYNQPSDELWYRWACCNETTWTLIRSDGPSTLVTCAEDGTEVLTPSGLHHPVSKTVAGGASIPHHHTGNADYKLEIRYVRGHTNSTFTGQGAQSTQFWITNSSKYPASDYYIEKTRIDPSYYDIKVKIAGLI